jgi:hypothetical protein
MISLPPPTSERFGKSLYAHTDETDDRDVVATAEMLGLGVHRYSETGGRR